MYCPPSYSNRDADIELPCLADPSQAAGPSPTSHWVIPGRLLCGAHPNVLLMNNTYISRMQNLLAVGITTFVDLTRPRDITDYQHPPNKYFDPNTPNYQPVAKQLAKSQFSREIAFVNFPIVDGNVGSFGSVFNLLLEICHRLANGECIYVHCMAGMGRAGTIMSCLIGMLYNMESPEALAKNRELHNCRLWAIKDYSPQRPCQFEQVKQILAFYHANKSQLRPYLPKFILPMQYQSTTAVDSSSSYSENVNTFNPQEIETNSLSSNKSGELVDSQDCQEYVKSSASCVEFRKDYLLAAITPCVK